MTRKIIGVYSTSTQLLADLEERYIKQSNSKVILMTAEPEQHQIMKESTNMKVILMETSSHNADSGIHNLATAFDEDDGSLELVKLEKMLLDEGFSEADAQECKTYLHKGMIVAAEKV
ncbi:MAG: hypothetical protein ACQEUT_07175 [Bacillota bacterium]